MRMKLLIIFGFLFLVNYVSCQTLTPAFDVDLDDEPEVRFASVLDHYKNYFVPFKKFVYDCMLFIFNGNKIPTANETAKAEFQVSLYEAAMDEYLFPKLSAEYQGEIEGISKATNISRGLLLLLNSIYEITAYCTSLVAEDPTGFIYHARNLDYGFGSGLTPTNIRDFVFTLNFKKNNELVYSGSTIFGMIGLPSACGFGRICITIDEHNYGSSLIENLNDLFIHDRPLMLLFIRDLVKNSTVDYNTAIKLAIDKKSASPYYLIISGTEKGQGTVITRTNNKVENVWLLSQSKHWYIVQTNNDHWLPPNNSWSSYRRQEAMKHLNALGQENLNYQSLLKIMNTYPTDNNRTVYSVVLNANTPSFYKTYNPIIIQ